MKIEKLLLGLFASFLMVGCSQNDDLPNGGEEAKGKDSYVSIKIKSDLTGSRATGDFYVGSATENSVNTVHFFFFNEDGSAFNVTVPSNGTSTYNITDNNGNVVTNITANKANYIVVSDPGNKGTQPDAGTNNPFEKILNPVVVFKVQDKNYPKKLVAVLNWDYSGDAPLSVKGLYDKVTNSHYTENSNNKYFIMCNSVYKTADLANTIDAVVLNESNFGATAGDANAHAVNVYVERLAAKVKVDLVKENNSENYKALGTGTEVKHLFSVNNVPNALGLSNVYAQLLGWELNTTAQESYLLKNLGDDWTGDKPFTGWNDYTNKRSNYSDAINSSYNVDFKWSNITKEFGSSDYCFENTSIDNVTNVIVRAKLGVFNGNEFTPTTIYGWYSQYYTTLDALKEAVATAISNEVTVSAAQIGYVSLFDPNNRDSHKAYQVKFTVADGTYSVPNSTSTKSAAEVNALLASKSPAKVWTDGATYYFTEIKHTDELDAVIRNNFYQVNVEKVFGLGTPVYVPDNNEPLIPGPVIPSEVETFISAQINVLSWRLVDYNVSLGQ